MSEVFCPQCGTGTGADEDGLCCACGATATGRALDRLLADYRTLRARVEGKRGEDTWPRPCDVCGEMLDCPSDDDEPSTAESIRCPDHPWGTCDWGRCNRPAFVLRASPEFDAALPVCIRHSEMFEALQEREALLAEIAALRGGADLKGDPMGDREPKRFVAHEAPENPVQGDVWVYPLTGWPRHWSDSRKGWESATDAEEISLHLHRIATALEDIAWTLMTRPSQ